MAKKEHKEQLKRYEGYINDIPLVIDLKKLNGIYSAMKDRCYYCKDRYYKDYGGRGITICDEWLNKEVVPNTHNATKGWLAFKNWAITNGYKKGLTKDDMYEAVIITPSGEWEKGIFRRTDCKCYWRIIGFNENVKVIAWCEIPTFDKE